MTAITNDYFKQVSEFNRTILGYTPPASVQLLPEEVKKLSLIQLREEVQELEDSKTATDEVDALLDLIYFAYGALYKMGITHHIFGAAHTIVHNANMTKAAGKKANRGYDGTAQDAVKPENFVPPETLISVLINDKDFS